MLKYTLEINGMACGMCEAHVKDIIRKFNVSKVTASCTRNNAEFISESEIDEEALKKAIGDTGYTVEKISSAPYEKKKFSLFGR